MRVLLVKMSSLGDLIHALPAITDAAAHGAKFDWVVEEAFTAIAERHPAVQQVLPIAWRRWRGDLSASRVELSAFFRSLRGQHYDLVIDAQGLWKSAAVAAAARSDQAWGFDRSSAREGLSTLLYRHHVPVPRDQHAIDRQRQLFASALGYPLPDSAPVFGIETNQSTEAGICLLCHGTTWPSKHWPETMWQELGRLLHAQGYQVQVPAGNELERQRASRIAGGCDAQVLSAVPLTELIDRLASASLVIGVDSGLSHLAAALGTPTVTLYGSTDASLTGARGLRASNIQAEFACSPCRARDCGYTGAAEFWQGSPVTPACYSRITPERVMQIVKGR